jgi:membrane-associated protein
MFDPHFQNHLHNIGYIANSLKGGSYFGMFLISILVGYVIPLPEVVLLLLVGFLVRTAGFNLPLVIVIVTLGGIIGDNILYRLSFFGNKYAKRFNDKMRSHKLIQYEYLVKDNIGKTILFLRLISGVRFFGPVVSGTLGVKWKNFFMYNAIATFLRGAIFIILAYNYHKKIVSLIAEVEIMYNVLLFSSVLIIGILIKIFSSKSNKKST